MAKKNDFRFCLKIALSVKKLNSGAYEIFCVPINFLMGGCIYIFIGQVYIIISTKGTFDKG